MQTILVVIILTSAVIYAVWRILRSILNTSDPCLGCSGCALKARNRENKACQEKKLKKNLADSGKSITFASANEKESWQSDRSRWTRNPVYPFRVSGV